MRFYGSMPTMRADRQRRTPLRPRRSPRRASSPAWLRRRIPTRTQPKSDWAKVATIIGLSLAGLPGLAAFVALIFTFQSVKATNVQLQIAQQGQITDRYNAAIANLGSRSIEVRLGGIFALQRLMQDSPRDQSTVVSILCAFVRDQTASNVIPKKNSPVQLAPTDIQAALDVVAT